MVSFDQAVAMAEALPEVAEGARYRMRTWSVRKRAFAWERPLGKADVKRLVDAGEAVPEGPIFALATADLGERDAILAAGTPGFFTIQHFAGYPAVLVQLDLVDPAALQEAMVDAWLAVAPAALAEQHAAALLTRR